MAVMAFMYCSARRIVRGLTLAAFATIAVGCHTAEGVKQDTKNALDATGKGLQKAAAKIGGKDDVAPQKTNKTADQQSFDDAGERRSFDHSSASSKDHHSSASQDAQAPSK